MDLRLAANLSFMFKERDFLERFRAAAACGKDPRSRIVMECPCVIARIPWG